jgi:AraC family transcriptional regulator
MQTAAAVSASTCFSSLRIAAYRGGSDMAPHSHEADSIGLPVSGHYLERIRGRETEHRLGDILYCPAGEVHSQYFAPGGMTKLLLAPNDASRDYLAHYLSLGEAPFRRADMLIPVALRLAREMRDPDPHSALIADGLGFELLGQFARAASGPARPARWLASARDYIHANAFRALSLTDVARHVGRDPGELSRSYRRLFGRSVGEEARAVRLHAAARLLTGSRQPIADIAAQCGFFDQAHLTRAFKAAYGMTPGGWRAAAR